MGAHFPIYTISIPKTRNTVKPLAEITKIRLIIDKILNNNDNRPPVIEKVLFYQNPIQRPKFKVGQQSSFTPDS